MYICFQGLGRTNFAKIMITTKEYGKRFIKLPISLQSPELL